MTLRSLIKFFLSFLIVLQLSKTVAGCCCNRKPGKDPRCVQGGDPTDSETLIIPLRTNFENSAPSGESDKTYDYWVTEQVSRSTLFESLRYHAKAKGSWAGNGVGEDNLKIVSVDTPNYTPRIVNAITNCANLTETKKYTADKEKGYCWPVIYIDGHGLSFSVGYYCDPANSNPSQEDKAKDKFKDFNLTIRIKKRCNDPPQNSSNHN